MDSDFDDCCAMIPARWESSRFPGKPLASIAGKPMVVHVCERAAAAFGEEHTFVATDSERIAGEVERAGYRVIMTSRDALTGTDRLAEAVAQTDYRRVINIQGDEPMVEPASILAVRDAMVRWPGAVVNAMAPLRSDECATETAIPKVAATIDGKLIYMSRVPVPGDKSGETEPGPGADAKGRPRYWKQVCIYGFTRAQLADFAARGSKTFLESFEDIEILRFLETGYEIRMVEVDSSSVAVDYPADVSRVEALMQAGDELPSNG